MQPQLALIEDQDDLREEMIRYLSAQGFSLWGVDSAERFYKQLHLSHADIVLVDVGLPGEDGLSVIDYLSANTPLGIIAVTAAGKIDDRLVGLELGADHYLVKPVDLLELCGTIKALWRRMIRQDRVRETDIKGQWRLNPAMLTIGSPSGKELCLTDQEFSLMAMLIQQAGQVVTKEELHRRVLSHYLEIDVHRIEVIISRIRKKAQDANMELPLRAVFGKGVVFVSGS